METTLLFISAAELPAHRVTELLHARFGPLGLDVEELSPLPGRTLVLRIGHWRLDVQASNSALAAGEFRAAMDSPLSRPFRGVLSDTLAHHTAHMSLILTSARTAGPEENRANTLLEQIRVLHGATACLAQALHPAAVHWGQSNQLLTGAQYLDLAQEETPWALVAKAQVSTVMPLDQAPARHGLRLPEAAQLIGRPVEFSLSDLPLEEMHAACLAFVRHALEAGSPIPDGHTFGPQNGRRYLVSWHEPETGMPEGTFELSVVSHETGTAPDGTACLSGATPLLRDLDAHEQETAMTDTHTKDTAPTHTEPGLQATAPAALPSGPASNAASDAAQAACRHDQRTRSLAISFLVLAFAPPLGALLMFINAIFGSNTWRTGLIATIFIGMAMIVGAYTFLEGMAPQTATLNAPAAISQTAMK